MMDKKLSYIDSAHRDGDVAAVSGHPAVLARYCVALHTALVVAAHKPVHIELNIKTALLLFGKERAVHGLLYPHQPRPYGMHGKVDRLVLDVRERGVLKISHQMRRHSEYPADLVHLELPCLQELRLVVGYAYGREGHVE